MVLLVSRGFTEIALRDRLGVADPACRLHHNTTDSDQAGGVTRRGVHIDGESWSAGAYEGCKDKGQGDVADEAWLF
jgi:hypothetical protein